MLLSAGVLCTLEGLEVRGRSTIRERCIGGSADDGRLSGISASNVVYVA